MEKLKEFFYSSPDIQLRAFSSVFIVLAIVGGVILGGIVWDVIASAAALLSLWEFYKLQSSRVHASPILVMASAFVILFGAAFGLMDVTAILCSISAIAFIALFLEVMKRQVSDGSDALAAVGATVAGIAYIVLPWTFMMLIRAREHGAMFLLTLFFCTWCCDVAAYFTGSHFGKTPLCSQVSPHKTWEGFAGGAAASFMCGGLLALIFSFPPLPLLLLGLLCGVAGQLGDLGESVLKREAGVKDTGNLIPGHGGVLDRFDSILVNATLAFVIFELVG
ncbi:phosphatidate cytidylyltransferase [Cloacibacillus sp. An23]|uniref:phosphatidate cytidylyltransferase n=1 Tax=Cloacibacillus sp. An23 TaxID=1965591 RepID=UPI000B379217|nr:phosphatidate cytidylyltransferase [Cloacibacillus sp. An23]OUO92215.1 phosphatidate cytidylyltransferase [Cloacibacillus sp. An23]